MKKGKTLYRSKTRSIWLSWHPARKLRCSFWFFSKPNHVLLLRRTNQCWNLAIGIGPLFLSLGPGFQILRPGSSNFIISFKEQAR